nr:MAG TPA: hypothetical protein [Caudoviricetes sp.]
MLYTEQSLILQSGESRTQFILHECSFTPPPLAQPERIFKV